MKRLYRNGVVQISDNIEKSNPSTKISILTNSLAEEVQLGDLFTVKQAQEFIIDSLNNLRNSRVVKIILSKSLENSIVQNVQYDAALTKKIREDAIGKISLSRGMVKKGELIISKGEVVIDDKFMVLESLKDEIENQLGSDESYRYILLGQIILVSLTMATLGLYLLIFRSDITRNTGKIVFLLLNILLIVFAAAMVLKLGKVVDSISIYIVPFCLIPIVTRAFFDSILAFFLYIVIVIITGFLAPNGFEFIFVELVSGLIAIFSIVHLRSRSQLFIASGLIIVVYSLVYFGINVIQEGSVKGISWINFVWFAGSGILSLLATPFIYLYEKIFGFMSDVTLMELSDTNNKLLRRLAEQAPGTFQHSMQVANLAEPAVHEIGGETLLVRAGAYYHDIGKIQNPMYFIENQQSHVNPHDELSSEESSKIIIDHVYDGIQLARKANLPDQIIDFIRTHHGTTTTEYFYRKYKEDHPEEEVDSEMFRYHGPKPYSKETSVLMMADSVEAASKSLLNHSEESISKLVDAIIEGHISDGQFSNADITFKDITVIKKMFKKKLMSIYHVRISYPEKK
ncbi:MAG: HDIG domain-containing protein [Flavobacteriales bacterium]|nr:HDIG domain-containing protein [Flavobacteriales bacterium]